MRLKRQRPKVVMNKVRGKVSKPPRQKHRQGAYKSFFGGRAPLTRL